MRSFFDTNVLAYTDDAGAPDKQAAALKLHAVLAERLYAGASFAVGRDLGAAARDDEAAARCGRVRGAWRSMHRSFDRV